jgi:Lrp/AsnC family leucine-responsive transcriptional regulator
MIDEIDIEILNIIQNNGRIPNAELARKLNMAPSGVLERVKKLEKEEVILGYEVRLNPKAIGLALTVFMHIKTSDAVGLPTIGQDIAQISGIQEVHWIAGEYNYLIKARVNTTDGLTDLMKAIGSITGVQDSRTTLVLDTLKECQTLNTEYTETKQTSKKPKKDL